MANDDDEKRSDDERDDNDSDQGSEGSGGAESASSESADEDDESTSSEPSGEEAAPASSEAAGAGPKAESGAGKRMSAGARLAAAKAAKAVVKASKKEERKAARDATSGEPQPAEPEAVEASTEPLAELNESELGRAALRAGRWWESNQQMGWVALAVAALAIVGFLGWTYRSDTQSVAAGELLAEAVEISGAPIEAAAEDAEEPESEATEDGAEDDAEEELTFPTRTARDEAALEAYRQVVSQFPDHPSAGIARLGVARALLALGQHDEARAAYQEAFDRNGRASHIAWQALEGMAFAQEAAGQAADAQATYDRLANLDDHAFEPIARYHLARLMMSRGERDEARTALRELVDSLRADTVENSTEPRFPFVLAQAEARLRELDPSSATSTGGSMLPGGGPGGPGGGLQVGGGEGGDIDPEQLQELIRQLQARQGGGEGGEGGE